MSDCLEHRVKRLEELVLSLLSRGNFTKEDRAYLTEEYASTKECWIAMDESGDWYLYYNLPSISNEEWFSVSRDFEKIYPEIGNPPHWPHSLIRLEGG